MKKKHDFEYAGEVKEEYCQNPSCSLCDTGCRINCKSRKEVYKISCVGEDELCKTAVYVGETSRSVTERFDEHSKEESVHNGKSWHPFQVIRA